MHIQMKNLVEIFLRFRCSKAMPTIFEFREGKASCLAALLTIPAVFFEAVIRPMLSTVLPPCLHCQCRMAFTALWAAEMAEADTTTKR